MHQFDQDARINIGPDGTVYDTWINSPTEVSLTGNQAMVAASGDGGRTRSASAIVARTLGPPPRPRPHPASPVSAATPPAAPPAPGPLAPASPGPPADAPTPQITH